MAMSWVVDGAQPRSEKEGTGQVGCEASILHQEYCHFCLFYMAGFAAKSTSKTPLL